MTLRPDAILPVPLDAVFAAAPGAGIGNLPRQRIVDDRLDGVELVEIALPHGLDRILEMHEFGDVGHEAVLLCPDREVMADLISDGFPSSQSSGVVPVPEANRLAIFHAGLRLPFMIWLR